MVTKIVLILMARYADQNVGYICLFSLSVSMAFIFLSLFYIYINILLNLLCFGCDFVIGRGCFGLLHGQGKSKISTFIFILN